MKTASYQGIRDAIREVGLSSAPVCVHASMRSFGPLEGGAAAVIQAFLDEGCTLIVPTFTYSFMVDPPEDPRPSRNGYDYASASPGGRSEAIYSPDSQVIVPDMGALPKAVLEVPGRIRSRHPICSFAALGPRAEALMAPQSAQDVYAPFARMREGGGHLALIGVDLRRATAIHYAEQIAGKGLFIRWARDEDGQIQGVRVGSCSEGFNAFGASVAPIETTCRVGRSHWRIFPMGPFVDRIAAALAESPGMGHCQDPHCLRCNDMERGGCD